MQPGKHHACLCEVTQCVAGPNVPRRPVPAGPSGRLGRQGTPYIYPTACTDRVVGTLLLQGHALRLAAGLHDRGDGVRFERRRRRMTTRSALKKAIKCYYGHGRSLVAHVTRSRLLTGRSRPRMTRLPRHPALVTGPRAHAGSCWLPFWCWCISCDVVSSKAKAPQVKHGQACALCSCREPRASRPALIAAAVSGVHRPLSGRCCRGLGPYRRRCPNSRWGRPHRHRRC